jgi:hypothetical protein
VRVRLGGLSRHVHVVRRLCPPASSVAFVPDNEFGDAVQAVHVRDDMDRILTLLAVQERLGLAAEGPLPPAALAQAAIEVHSLRNCSADTQIRRRGGEMEDTITSSAVWHLRYVAIWKHA